MAQVQVYPAGHLPDQSKLVKGSIVTYALPTTTLKMTVSVSKVQDVRGYFADYAESLLGLTNIIQQFMPVIVVLLHQILLLPFKFSML